MARGPPFSPSASSQRGAVRVVPKALWPSVQLRLRPHPPHRALDDDRHAVGRLDLHRHRRVGQARDPDRRRRSCGGCWPPRCRSSRPARRWPGCRSPARVAAVAFGLASSMNIEKKPPVDPSARNQFSDGAVTPALLWPPLNALLPRVEIHRALDDDRHAVGRGDLGRDVGRPQGLVFLVDPDGEAAAGADAVGLDDRRARRPQVADPDGRPRCCSGSGSGRTDRTCRASRPRRGTSVVAGCSTAVSMCAA